jgi:phosphohistidine phosphatase
MRLILLRHGIAADLRDTPPRADGRPTTDADRPLTERGRRRLKRAARGLRRLGVRPDRILHSGLVRARETAERIVAGLDVDAPEFVEISALVPEADPADFFKLLPSLAAEQLLCVAHAPILDRILALACGVKGRLFSALGKAGAVCLELPDSGRAAGRVVWFLPPKLLRRFGEERRRR